MILRQYLHTDPVIAASHLFGCGREILATNLGLPLPVEA